MKSLHPAAPHPGVEKKTRSQVSSGAARPTSRHRNCEVISYTNGIGAVGVAGNGTGKLVEMGVCPNTISIICYEEVSADGGRTVIVDQQHAFNAIIQYAPAMDPNGNVWVMAALSSGWAYYEVTAAGGTVHNFAMPALNGYDTPHNPPVITFDGALWMEMGCNPDYLLRVQAS
jgi:hypothetical protein